MSRVLSIVAEKGGVSKTTLATSISSAIQRAGGSVILLDCDPQHTAYSWAHLDGPPKPRTVLAEARRLERDVAGLQGAFDWIVIDTQPGVSRDTVHAVNVADSVLVPLRPGVDLWAASTTAQIVRGAMDARPALQAALVLVQEIHGTVLGRAVWAKLSELGIPTLQTRVEMRVAYAEALLTGQNIFDLPDSKAHHEIESIVTEITAQWASK